jgi:hypothetical protein
MRKIITLVYALVFLAIASCETDRIIFKGPYFVRFTEISRTEKESYSKPIEIQVHNAGPALDADVKVTYRITGNAREGTDYTILSERETITIKKGTYFGVVQIQLINNANNILRSQDIILTLQSVSTSKLQVGQGESAIGKIYKFTILDDCILGGNYIGQKDALSVPVEGITITSQDCEEYTLSNWDIGVFNFSQVRDLIFIDNGDNTLTIPEQKESTLPANLATIRGSGIVDPLTRKITMKVTLADFQNQPVASFTLIPD